MRNKLQIEKCKMQTENYDIPAAQKCNFR